MQHIYLLSGPCGCGKTTLASAFAKQLDHQAYLIHGDDFHAGFIEPENPAVFCCPWEDVLRFNWECILTVTRIALNQGLDVVIDYVVEDELPLVRALAEEYNAALHYFVLTASDDTLCRRLHERGDDWLIERALFLRDKLNSMPENQNHLIDITGMSVAEAISLLRQRQ